MLLCGCHVRVGTSNELGGGEGDDVESKVTRIRGLRCAVSPKFNTLFSGNSGWISTCNSHHLFCFSARRLFVPPMRCVSDPVKLMFLQVKMVCKKQHFTAARALWKPSTSADGFSLSYQLGVVLT